MTTVTDADFAEWTRLAEPSLSPAVALRVAVDGNPEQIAALCRNPALPVDVMLTLVNRADPLAAALLLGNDIPTEIVIAAVEAHPDLHEVAVGSYYAPVAMKLALPLAEVTGAALEGFLAAVRATPEETASLAMVMADDDRQHETLGAVWAAIRTAA